ncbi:unnamed protein product [Ophioblennius macclurei]
MAVIKLLLLAVALAAGGQRSEVQVPRGGVVILEEAELQLRNHSADNCKVEVVTDEPMTQRVGQLTPEIFDCHFGTGEVQYRHNGNPLLDRDAVLLRVYWFTVSETYVDSVTITVRIVDHQSDTVALSDEPLLVAMVGGVSNIVDESKLTIQTPPGTVCTVRLIHDVGFPVAGRLIDEKGAEFTETSCSNFANSGLKYKHLQLPSPNRDYVPIRAEIQERDSGYVIKSVGVWLLVIIRDALSNFPPRVAAKASLVMEADRFVLTALTAASLDAEDEDTPRERLVFNISTVPRDGGGYVTLRERPNRPIGSFTWSDLHQLKVAYQPPADGIWKHGDNQVELSVLDDFLSSSPPFFLRLHVRSSHTNAPRVSWNMGLELLEGSSRPITWEQLQVVDDGDVEKVQLTIIQGPKHGRITVRGSRSFSLGVPDLRSGSVFYHHSDDESSSDSIVFRISDGRHSARHRFPIRILPKDDSAPALLTNMAAEVQAGGAVRLSEALLFAADLDSDDDLILYTLEAPPTSGRVMRRSFDQEEGQEVDRFVQSDLLASRIFYRHSGDNSLEDSFDFTLSDRNDPPNRSDKYTMVIQVFPLKRRLPVEVAGSVRSLTLKETDVVHLTTANLNFRDYEEPGADLAYTVTTSCFSPMQPGLVDAGRLVYVDGALKKDATAAALKSFTQLAIRHLKVAFMPPLEDVGLAPLFVQFVLSVSDHRGGIVSGVIFNVTVLPVDNQAPEVFSTPLVVKEGGVAFISEEQLLLSDADTPLDGLRVELGSAPRHGTLELWAESSTSFSASFSSFTLRDLQQRNVRYVHDDSETTEDEMHLTVTDGINSAAVVLSVQVFPVNDKPPQLSGNLRVGLTCHERGRVPLMAHFLLATNSDVDNAALSYTLARHPAWGELQVAGTSVERFSQQDLQGGAIYYVHTGGEIGPDPVSDVLTLVISNDNTGVSICCRGDVPPPPFLLPVLILNVTVMPVDDQPPNIHLGPSQLLVDEGSSSCLCNVILGATDTDTPPDRLAFFLEARPLYGFLENTQPPAGSEKSGAGVPVESFSSAHLGCINYVQSEHRGAEPTVDQMTISVSDGHQRSAPVIIHVVIRPTNDEPPSLQLANFTVREGGTLELTPPLLDGADLDAPPDNVTFSVVTPPVHGCIVRQSIAANGVLGPDNQPISSFSLEQLRHGLLLLYQHDDSESLSDSLTIRLTDGKHWTERTNQITVLPINDCRPTLSRNRGLEVDPGQIRVISSLFLDSEDLDSDPDQIFYQMEETPRYGQLKIKTDSGWKDVLPGQNFSQHSVDQNQLWYQHQGDSTDQDRIRFRVSDLDQDQDQELHTFFISIRKKEKGDLKLRVTSPVHVAAGGYVFINTDVLLGSDLATAPGQLVYTVTSAPRSGLLHFVRRPGVLLASFTQLDVAAQRVCYSHDNSGDSKEDTFSIRLSNGVSSVVGSILVLIQHGHPVPPTLLVNAPLIVSIGTVATIGPAHLQLGSPDTPPSKLKYRVSRPPLHGGLFLRGAELVAPLIIFTQRDVDRLELEYRHRPESQMGPDHFLFLIEEKEEPARFDIQVRLGDVTAPSVSVLSAPSVVRQLAGGRHGILVTTQHLKASDPDSPTHLLEFLVHAAPQHGYLQNTATGSYISTRFTQRDVDQRNVMFVLADDVAVTTDSFTFCVVDPGGNSSPPETLQLFWSQVEFSTSCYRVCESEAELRVSLRRRGRSQDPAYVRIQVEEVSPKGPDFRQFSSKLIQFDPGVYLKHLPLPLPPQSVRFVLQEVDNVILGALSSASVELLYQSGGLCDNQDQDVELDLEAELIWEDMTPPPRGDVPNRRPFEDDWEEAGAQDQYQIHPHNQNQGHAHSQDQGHAHNQDQGQGHNQDQDQGHTHNQDGHNQDGDQGYDLDTNRDQVWTFHGLIPLRMKAGWRLEPEPEPRGHQEDQAHKCPPWWTLHAGSCFRLSSSVATCCSAHRTCSMSGGSLSSASSPELVSWLWKFVGKEKFWTRPTGERGQEVGASCVLVEGLRRLSFSGCSDEAQHAFVCEAPPIAEMTGAS